MLQILRVPATHQDVIEDLQCQPKGIVRGFIRIACRLPGTSPTNDAQLAKEHSPRSAERDPVDIRILATVAMNTAMVFGSAFTPRLAAPQHARSCRQSARAMRMVRAEAATAGKDLGFKTMRAGIKEVRYIR